MPVLYALMTPCSCLLGFLSLVQSFGSGAIDQQSKMNKVEIAKKLDITHRNIDRMDRILKDRLKPTIIEMNQP